MADLIIASTTDNEDQIKAALGRGIDAPAEEPVLGEVDATTGEPIEPAETPAEPAKPAAPEPPAEPAAEKVEKAAKPAEKTEKTTRFDKRVAQLTAEKYTQMRRAESLEAQVQELQRRLEAIATGAAPLPTAPQTTTTAQTTTPAPAEAGQEPTPDKFKTYEDYVRALTAYTAQQTVQAQLQEQAQAAQQAAQQVAAEEARQRFETTRTEAAQRYPDFEETMQSEVAQALPLTDPMQYVIATNPLGHDLAYYLVKHPDACDEIVRLSPPDQILAMGRLAATVEASLKPSKVKATTPAVEAKPVSKAPEPIEPVGTSTTVVTLSDDDMDYGDWKAKRNREETERRLARRGIMPRR